MSAVTRRSSSDFYRNNMSSFYFNPIVELDLEEEIRRLELQILHLERSLLNRYRTAFKSQVESLRSPKLSDSPPPAKHKRISLADHLAASKPDTLSSDIVRCVASIYCKFQTSPSRASSQSSSSSSSASTSTSSSVLSSNDASESPDGMIHVLNIRLDDAHTFNYAATMLQKFRSLVRNLEKIDPRKMKHEEKLAFWINIHNALLMHAYLAYGSDNVTKRDSVFKASYNIGGIHVNAHDIQSSILGIRSRNSSSSSSSASSPAWFRGLFQERSPTASRHEYALERPEPLAHFALAYGFYGDPPLRSYAAIRIVGDLKTAKHEFVKGSVEIVGQNKRRGVCKALVPRVVYNYVKDMCENGKEIEVQGVLEEELVNVRAGGTTNTFIHIRWLPNSSTFGYVIHPHVPL